MRNIVSRTNLVIGSYITLNAEVEQVKLDLKMNKMRVSIFWVSYVVIQALEKRTYNKAKHCRYTRTRYSRVRFKGVKRIAFLILILYSPFAVSNEIACRYLSKKEPELIERANCLTITKPPAIAWDALISKYVALDAIYNKLNLAYLYSSEGIFYFQQNGKIMRTVMYDNGPDYFSDGLVRTIRDNKYGFMNEKLDIIVERKFDFAFPFKNGKAKVCMGCVKVYDGEHSTYEGGTFYFINKFGQKID